MRSPKGKEEAENEEEMKRRHAVLQVAAEAGKGAQN